MLDESQTVVQRQLERLPDRYDRRGDGDNGKLLTVIAKPVQENEETLRLIDEWRDIDKAPGVPLDLLGTNVQQYRGQATDEVYRVLIKSKIKRNLSNGSIDTIIDYISFLLQIPPSDVNIVELWETENRPAALHVDVPTEAVNKTGLSLKQFGTLVNVVASGGVRAEVLFTGTFSFSSDPNAVEIDVNTGFANDAQTTGGTLGSTYDPNTDYELPL